MVEYNSSVLEEIKRINEEIIEEGGGRFIPNGNVVGMTNNGIYIYFINFDNIKGEEQYKD